MTEYQLRYLCNLNMEKFLAGYKPADEVMDAGATSVAAADDYVALEHAFMFWNVDTRPNGQTAPSLSVGDVVELTSDGGEARYYACATIGWDKVERPLEVEAAGTVADELRRRHGN